MTRNKCSFYSPNTVLPQKPQSSYCTISLLSSLLEPHPSWCGGDATHSPAVITLLQRNRVYSPMARKFLPYHFRLFRKETKVDQGIEQELTTSNALQETQRKRKKKKGKKKKAQRKENGMITYRVSSCKNTKSCIPTPPQLHIAIREGFFFYIFCRIKNIQRPRSKKNDCKWVLSSAVTPNGIHFVRCVFLQQEEWSYGDDNLN